MKEKKIFTVIYLLLLVSVVGNVMFFVNWLGSHSKQEKKSQEQAELVMTLEEENTQLKSRIDELLTTESEADSSFGEENTQVTDPGEEEATVELPESNEKQVAFLEEFARLQFGMGADQRAENLAQLGTLMSAEAFQELNGSADVVPSAIGYTIEVEATEIYRQLATENTNDYLIVVHQKTKTDQENATAVQSRLYYRVTLGSTAEGTLLVEQVSALMPYQ